MKKKYFNNSNLPSEIGPPCLISDGAQYKYQKIKSKNKEYSLSLILLIMSLLFLMFFIRIIKVNIVLIVLALLELIYYCDMVREKSVRKIRLACRHFVNKLKGAKLQNNGGQITNTRSN